MITEKTLVADALRNSKAAHKVFSKHNLYCAGCRGSVQATIEKVAENNGLDIKKFLSELNAAAKK